MLPISEGMNSELASLIDQRVVIKRGDYPHLANQIDWARASGWLVSVLPGFYAAAGRASEFLVRALAVCMADPDAVLLGASAERVVGGPKETRDPAIVEVASQRLHSRAWLRVSRRRIAPERVVRVGRLASTDALLTAIDRAVETDGSSIDDALRRRAKLDGLHAALRDRVTRRGRVAIRRFLRDSRDIPWSWAERRAHVLLRGAGITGWESNSPVEVALGRTVYVDLAFPELHLVIEIDGAQWHLFPGQVLADRERDLDVSKRGWTVVRVSATLVIDDPAGFVAAVRTLVAVRRRRLRRCA